MEKKKKIGRGEKKVAREEKTNDSWGTGMEHSLGCCSLRSCNEMGVFLGCSLLRPWHRPIGGCCYLQLRDLPSPFRLQLKPWLGFASSHRTHVSSGKLGGSNGQRIVRDLRRSSAKDHPDQRFHRETKFSPGKRLVVWFLVVWFYSPLWDYPDGWWDRHPVAEHASLCNPCNPSLTVSFRRESFAKMRANMEDSGWFRGRTVWQSNRIDSTEISIEMADVSRIWLLWETSNLSSVEMKKNSSCYLFPGI